ncbi:MAG: cell division protein FtsA [Candidatus Harrisonbacteria bacterium]|nr:cell division protein FtsA [Candidatus Harrisonbacteria bacterium]
MSKFIVGFDVGSQSIRAAVAEYKRGQGLSLVALKHFPAAGMRRGVVDNIQDASHALSAALRELEQEYPRSSKNLILSVGSEKSKSAHSKGVVAVSRADDEIYQDDVNRVTQSSHAVNLAPNRIVLHTITQEFIVDGVEGIRDPIGMTGKRLEANSLIIDDFTPAVRGLTKLLEELGAGIVDIVFSPLAASQAVLSKKQKELGVVVIDIGYGKTGFSIYEEQLLLHTGIIPIGSSHITNDLAIGLKIPVEAAETIKLSFGSASTKGALSRDKIDLSKIDERAQGMASKKLIAEIIEARLLEIFEHVSEEIKRVNRDSQLPAGAVFVGAGSALPGLAELGKAQLRLSTQIGSAQLGQIDVESSEISLEADQPEFATAIGLLLYNQLQYSPHTAPRSQISSRLKRVLKYFIP